MGMFCRLLRIVKFIGSIGEKRICLLCVAYLIMVPMTGREAPATVGWHGQDLSASYCSCD